MPLRVLAEQADQPADGNPYITALYRSLRDLGVEVTPFNRGALLNRPDIVHVHWPEQIVRWHEGTATALLDVVKVLALITIARARGARLVWTGHDLGPHEMPLPRLYRAYLAVFIHEVDMFISLSKTATEAMRARYPRLRRTPTTVVVHGHYRDAYPAAPSKTAARAALGLDPAATVFLLLGQIRRYKAVPDLIRAFRGHAPGEAIVIAGRVIGRGLEAELIEAAADDPAVVLHLEQVPAARVPTYVSAADVVVLPYSIGTALHSGVALLAASFDRPVVVRRSPTMQELQAEIGDEWVRTFDGAAEQALATARSAASTPRGPSPDLSAFEWDLAGRLTLDAYKAAIKRPRATGTGTSRQQVRS